MAGRRCSTTSAEAALASAAGLGTAPPIRCRLVTRPGLPEQTERLVTRDRPMMTMRLTYRPASGLGSPRQPATATIEWAGRVGHPASYGLLGGAQALAPRIGHFRLGNPLYKRSLARGTDEVRWGLTQEYEEVVAATLATQPVSVSVSSAAVGQLGSSAQVFKALTIMLCRVLGADVPRADADVWRLWDRCWNET